MALIFTIALGIGSNVVIYGFIRGLMREPPVPGIGEIVSLFGSGPRGELGPLSYEDYLTLKARPDTFEWIGAARVGQPTVIVDGQPSTLTVAAVTPEMARLFYLDVEEGVIVSHRVRGDRIVIDGVDTRVKGVAPDWLEGVYRDRAIDLWTAFREDAAGAARNFWVLARLRPGVSLNNVDRISVLPYRGLTPGAADDAARVGRLLGLAAAAVFFMACANVFSFLLGRSSTRSHEASLRVALGASREQLIRERLADSTVISILGGVSGTLLAYWTSRIVPALLFDQDAARLVFAPDPAGILWASAACAGITLLCGAVPALAIPHDRPAAVLRRESAGPSPVSRWFRAAVVVIQMTSCFVLLLSTAFLVDGLQSALRTGAGARLSQPVIATVQGAGMGYFRRVEEVARSMPGVTEAQWTAVLPGIQAPSRSFRIEPRPVPMRPVAMDIAWFTTDSLSLFVLPPTAGRLFGFEDLACRAAVINNQAAAALFGESTPGRTVRDPAGASIVIVGVVAARKAQRPTIYYYTDPTRPTPPALPPAVFRTQTASKLVTAELEIDVVSPGYFEGGGPVAGSCRTGMVNREAADLYFDGKAVGAAVIDERGQRTEITGVVQPAPLVAFQRREGPAIYFPMEQDAPPVMSLILGMRKGHSPDLADLLRRVESVPGRGPLPIIVKTLAQHLSQTAFAPLRIATVIVGASATTALVLGVLGLYGALSDAARQRRRELGVRIAFGAQRHHVILQMLKEGGRLACAGVLTGAVAWLVVSRFVAGLAPAGAAPPWWAWLAAPLVLAAAVAIASVLPARRALLVDPATIMRDT